MQYTNNFLNNQNYVIDDLLKSNLKAYYKEVNPGIMIFAVIFSIIMVLFFVDFFLIIIMFLCIFYVLYLLIISKLEKNNDDVTFLVNYENGDKKYIEITIK